jgi:DNA (cytosine-5)-methyltransferase 1
MLMANGHIRLLSLFCGYGTDNFALNRLGVSRDLVGYSDIDRYANQCFKQNHCPWDTDDKLRLGDASLINPHILKDFDLLTGGFPCQAFSIAGKGLGELDTRGTLFNEIIRIAEVKNPRYMMLENVKGLISKTHKPTFDKIISELYRIGYFVKWKVLNTKEHGIPQNRERIFFCCFNRWEDFCNYEWPLTEELKIFLKDILEDEVDEKYYLSEIQIQRLLKNTTFSKNYIQCDINNTGHHSQTQRIHTGNVIGCLPTNCGDLMILGNVNPSGRGMNGNVYAGKFSPTITTNKGEGIKILQRPHGANNGGIRAKDGVVPTITSGACWEHNNYLSEGDTIRKLTPLECFRLQGFLHDEVKVSGLSNTQLYKLAGNGQSVNVVEKILKNMLGVGNE